MKNHMNANYAATLYQQLKDEQNFEEIMRVLSLATGEEQINFIASAKKLAECIDERSFVQWFTSGTVPEAGTSVLTQIEAKILNGGGNKLPDEIFDIFGEEISPFV